MFCFLTALAATRLWASDAAVIVNSGSTNTPGFRITVERSGNATYAPMPRRGGPQRNAQSGQAKPLTRTISTHLAKRFYADLDGARPLTSAPSRGCMKSASFGVTLTVEYAGEKSPDLSCGDHGDSHLKALIADTDAIVKQFP